MPARRSRLVVIVVAGVLFLGLPALGWLILGRIFNPPIRPSIASRLADLFDAGRYQDLVDECEFIESDPEYAAAQPQILYVEWAAERKLGNLSETDQIERTFLERFPDDPLAAEFHFTDAMQLLADQKYQEADEKLAMIKKNFPTAPVSSRCVEIRKNLARYLAAATKESISQ